MKKVTGYLVLIGMFTLLLVGCSGANSEPAYENITSDDGSLVLTLPTNIEFFDDDKSDMSVYSTDEGIYITVERLPNVPEVTLLEYAKEQKDAINAKDISEDIEPIEIQDYEAYTYFFNYFNKEYDEEFYNQTVWVKTEENCYHISLKVIAENQTKHENLLNAIALSFKEQ